MAAAPVCAVCETPLTPREALEGPVCMRRPCIAEQLLRDERATLAEDAAGDAREVTRFADAHREGDELVAGLPAANAPLVPAVPARQRRFRERLRDVLRDAALIDRSGDVMNDHEAEEAPHLTAACMLCRGACCATGGIHAYLHSGFLANVLAKRADEPPARIYRDYVRRLPDESCKDACVYQGAMGCVLPRGMRSDVCNTYSCRSRGAFEAQLSAAPQKSTLAVSVRDGRTVAAARIGADGSSEEVFRDE